MSAFLVPPPSSCHRCVHQGKPGKARGRMLSSALAYGWLSVGMASRHMEGIDLCPLLSAWHVEGIDSLMPSKLCLPLPAKRWGIASGTPMENKAATKPYPREYKPCTVSPRFSTVGELDLVWAGLKGLELMWIRAGLTLSFHIDKSNI